jgi:hypothetical protein
VLNWWQQGTMQTYGPYLRFLGRFDNRYGTSVLEATRLHRPPSSSSIPLMWAQLLYSLRVHKGERIKFNTIRQIRSAAASYYTWDLHHVYPGRIRRERERDTIRDFVSPSEQATMTFATKGMARRLGTATKPSWALSFIHIEYTDRRLRNAYRRAQTADAKHEFACAGIANLLGYLGWLRGTELFLATFDNLKVIGPSQGAAHGLPPNLGAILLDLLPETKSNPCQVADLVIAYATLSGLHPGEWIEALMNVEVPTNGRIFSTTTEANWTSRYFRETYAWPLLEEMRTVDKEPTLLCFTNEEGNRIRDKIYSMHSWRRAGRSRVSRAARHNEPQPRGTRKATPTEVYEHGRWTNRCDQKGEDMAALYNQWGMIERLAITLFYM